MKRLSISFILFLFFVLVIILAQGLFAQTPVSPANGAIGVSQSLGSVSWSNFDGGNGNGPYDVEFDDDPSFGSPDASAYKIAHTSLSLPSLNYNTTYYWRVRDTDTDGSGGDGFWHNFIFTTVLATPNLSNPINGGSFPYSSPVAFTWNQDNNRTNVKYTIDLSTQGGVNFDANIISTHTTVINPGSLSHSFPILTAGTYYWRVKAIVDDGSAPNDEEEQTSSIFSFNMTLPGPTLIAPLNGLTGVSILPTLIWSPVSGSSSYRLQVSTTNRFLPKKSEK